MAAGLGELRLEPRAFWAMTLPELEAALGIGAACNLMNAPLARSDLSRLITQFPDRESQ